MTKEKHATKGTARISRVQNAPKRPASSKRASKGTGRTTNRNTGGSALKASETPYFTEEAPERPYVNHFDYIPPAPSPDILTWGEAAIVAIAVIMVLALFYWGNLK